MFDIFLQHLQCAAVTNDLKKVMLLLSDFSLRNYWGDRDTLWLVSAVTAVSLSFKEPVNIT